MGSPKTSRAPYKLGASPNSLILSLSEDQVNEEVRGQEGGVDRQRGEEAFRKQFQGVAGVGECWKDLRRRIAELAKFSHDLPSRKHRLRQRGD